MLSFKLKGNYTECDYTLASHFVKYTSTKLDPPLTSWWKHLTCDSCPYWHDSIKQVLHIGWPHIYDANRLFKHIPKVLCWIELCGRHLSTVNPLHSRNQFGMISDVWHSRYTIQVWSQRDRQNSMWHKKKSTVWISGGCFDHACVCKYTKLLPYCWLLYKSSGTGVPNELASEYNTCITYKLRKNTWPTPSAP